MIQNRRLFNFIGGTIMLITLAVMFFGCNSYAQAQVNTTIDEVLVSVNDPYIEVNDTHLDVPTNVVVGGYIFGSIFENVHEYRTEIHTRYSFLYNGDGMEPFTTIDQFGPCHKFEMFSDNRLIMEYLWWSGLNELGLFPSNRLKDEVTYDLLSYTLKMTKRYDWPNPGYITLTVEKTNNDTGTNNAHYRHQGR